MGVGSGDRLARGNAKASWGPLDVSDEKWAAAFAPAEPEVEAEEPKEEKPVSRVRVGIK